MYSAPALAELGERIDEEEPQGHELALQHLAGAVQHLAPGSASALRDRRAPTVFRQRAFAVAAATMLRRSMRPEKQASTAA
jgi:hypothetical protein